MGREVRRAPIAIADVVFSVDERQLISPSGVVKMSALAAEALFAMVTRPNRALSRDFLYVVQYGRFSEVSDKAIDVVICRLRNYLKRAGLPRSTIRVSWRVGWLFVGDPSEICPRCHQKLQAETTDPP
jgi:DNA-binding response OmpR family regulator